MNRPVNICTSTLPAFALEDALRLAACAGYEGVELRVHGNCHVSLQELQRRYLLKPAELRPKVYYRLTDNWIELTVRFLVADHGVRAVKDAMSRDILTDLEQAGIKVASATVQIVGLPTLEIAPSGIGVRDD